jgi:hypothetical protein
MSNDADQEYGPTPPGAAYEHTDIEPGVGYRFALWLAVAMALSAAFVYGIFVFLGSQAVARDNAARTFPLAQGVSQEPPSPRLQTQPFKDVYQLKSQQQDVLTSYGWVDKANGVAHIPIARAMELTLQRGLPARAGDDSLRSTIVQDSSGGRTTSGR